MDKKFAFTLAELMITFAIIGVLTAILIPSLFKSTPNEEILKAKKAFNTFSRAMENLTNSGVYTDNGGILTSTSFVSDADSQEQFFCNNLIDTINVKKADCTKNKVEDAIQDKVSSNCDLASGSPTYVCAKLTSEGKNVDLPQLQKDLDTVCKNWKATVGTDYNFATTDNVLWGIQLNDFANNSTVVMGGLTLPAFYNVVCFSTDGLKLDDNVFGIGVRKDGKIIASEALQNILDAE